MPKHAVCHYGIILNVLTCLFICNLFNAAIGDIFIFICWTCLTSAM